MARSAGRDQVPSDDRFGQALPRIREPRWTQTGLPGLPREKVLATVVRLLETTLIRVGNDEYARENRSFGLTTLRDRHVEVEGSTLRFRFSGKSGISMSGAQGPPHRAGSCGNARICPGRTCSGTSTTTAVAAASSTDVNDYLREISGQEFTAKDFRTWAGTVLAARAPGIREFDSETQAKKNIVQAIEAVASRLGNTPTVCRKCYVHPEVLNAYLEGTTLRTVVQRARQELTDSLSDLEPEEAAVMALLYSG